MEVEEVLPHTADDALDRAHYPVSDVETDERGDEMMDVVATLVSTSVVPHELDAVVTELGKRSDIDHATWEIVAQG